MTPASPSAPASAESVRALFEAQYGRAPEVIASAPGRVNLIGEHTDYNGGEVLPIAIARRTWVAAGRRRAGGAPLLRAVSSDASAAAEVALDPAAPAGTWSDYLVGVAAPLLASAGNQVLRERSLDVAVVSDVPSGAGLSSSAALEVATALAVSALLGPVMSHRDAAMAAWRAETSFVGVQCGIMDQFASALGQEAHALHLHCDDARTALVPFGEAVLIIDTQVRRALRDSAFNTRRAECTEALRLLRLRHPALVSLAEVSPEQVIDARLPDPLDRRALHVSRETRRVREAVALLGAGKPMTRELLVGSHESLRDLYECSRAELDWLVEHASEMDGVRGARLTGAGWGGCAIVVGPRDALEAAAPELARRYEERFGLVPRLWLSHAAAGARVDTVAG